MNGPDSEAVLQDEGGCAICTGKVTAEEVAENNKKHNDDGLVKISAEIPDSGGRTENLWAARTGKPDEFEIRNTPFFIDEFNCMDIVRAEPCSNRENYYNFVEVVERKTETHCLKYEVDCTDEELRERFPILCEELREKDYNPEGMVKGLFVVGVPYGEGTDGIREVIENTKSGLVVSFYDEDEDG